MDLRDPITNVLIRLIDDPLFSAFGITDIFRVSDKFASGRKRVMRAVADGATLKIT